MQIQCSLFIYLFIFHPWLSRQGVYSEVYRVLKPGQYFALDEWCLTDRFDPNNAKHLAIKAEIELGDGLPDIRTTHQCVQAMKDAGFEVPYSYY
jgi:sterol 24-C-methyltransferase